MCLCVLDSSFKHGTDEPRRLAFKTKLIAGPTCNSERIANNSSVQATFVLSVRAVGQVFDLEFGGSVFKQSLKRCNRFLVDQIVVQFKHTLERRCIEHTRASAEILSERRGVNSVTVFTDCVWEHQSHRIRERLAHVVGNKHRIGLG